VDHDSGAFVGIDTSKLRNAVAVAEGGRGGDVRYLGEIDTTEAATRKLVAKLAAKYRQLTFCYEGLTKDIRVSGPAPNRSGRGLDHFGTPSLMGGSSTMRSCRLRD
jgi:hypothetical protein